MFTLLRYLIILIIITEPVVSRAQAFVIESFPKGTTIDEFASSYLSRKLNEIPIIQTNYMTTLGISGDCSVIYSQRLNFKRNGLQISFKKYGVRDTFHFEYIELKKRNDLRTIDNIGAKQELSLNELNLSLEYYFETSINDKKYGLIKKGNIKYFLSYLNKDKVNINTKFKIKFIEIYPL